MRPIREHLAALTDVNARRPGARHAGGMKPFARIAAASLGLALAMAGAHAQSVLFDFDGAPLHAPLPLDVGAGGVVAHLSATGQGFSIQRADTMGFTPAGFGGNAVYPSSVFAADLIIAFSEPLSAISILYAPQELACDASARMRITGDLAGVLVATATTTAPIPGTWPTGTLELGPGAMFDRVVIHYDAAPACGDWGPIFMADNMAVVPAGPIFADGFE